jgi:hypothetical protein
MQGFSRERYWQQGRLSEERGKEAKKERKKKEKEDGRDGSQWNEFIVRISSNKK